MYTSHWKSSRDLGLYGDLDREWELFRSALNNSGATVNEKVDTLCWARGEDSGVPSVRNFYMNIIRSKNLNKI